MTAQTAAITLNTLINGFETTGIPRAGVAYDEKPRLSIDRLFRLPGIDLFNGFHPQQQVVNVTGKYEPTSLPCNGGTATQSYARQSFVSQEGYTARLHLLKYSFDACLQHNAEYNGEFWIAWHDERNSEPIYYLAARNLQQKSASYSFTLTGAFKTSTDRNCDSQRNFTGTSLVRDDIKKRNAPVFRVHQNSRGGDRLLFPARKPPGMHFKDTISIPNSAQWLLKTPKPLRYLPLHYDYDVEPRDRRSEQGESAEDGLILVQGFGPEYATFSYATSEMLLENGKTCRCRNARHPVGFRRHEFTVTSSLPRTSGKE